jgi:hypothetical protein
MTKEAKVGRVTSDPVSTLHHVRSPLLDGVSQFGTAIEAMNALCEGIARILVRRLGWSHYASRDASLTRSPLHAGERFAHVKAERCIERERSIVKGSLDQSHPDGSILLCAIQHRLHELTTGSGIL